MSVHVYMTKGLFRFQDPSSGEIHECRAGTKFMIPEKTLHIEEEHQGYSAIVGMSEAELPDPFVRPPEELDA